MTAYQPVQYPRKRRIWPFVVGAALLSFCLIGAIAAIAGQRDPKPTPTPTVTMSVPSVHLGGDLGAGTPGAGCATNRLGKTFYQDGQLYRCSGPKPYRWRPASSGGGR